MIDLGTHEKVWADKTRRSHEVRISWELPLETADFGKGEQPFSVHKTYTLSLSEKANLRHDLETWRSRPFTEEELQEFDVSKVLGAACMVSVVHVTKGTNTYANVVSVTAVPKGMVCPILINPLVEFSLESHDEAVFRSLPDFLKEIIQSSDEWKQQQSPAAEPEDDRLPGGGNGEPEHYEPATADMPDCPF